ncbi:MAG: purine/pyrimidine permease [Chloroflexota bacterium]|nr:purine/pyrimidine permease [Chloroflexota bacterium]
MATTQTNASIRYEPDENPPLLIVIGAGVQAALINLAAVVLAVVIVIRISGVSESYIPWAIFATLVVSGVSTFLQAARVWRIGAGHVLVMGTSGAFFAVCVAALANAGPATMATLIIVSSLFQFLMASRLSLLRRIFTPLVTGTVILLIAVTVMPLVFDLLTDVPEGSSPIAAPIAAIVTLVVIAVMVMRAPPSMRLWSPIIGIVIGCLVAAPFGLYDTEAIIDAAWFGVPLGTWPGIELTPGVEFWALLPAFVVVTLVGAMETVGDGVAVQQVSRRTRRATDFRVVQGALNADGVGNLLSGLLGTLPNTTYSSSVSLVEVTGVASRRVGIAIGVVFLILAFLPKATALLIAIPPPVAAAYFTILIVMLFVQGMRMVMQDGVDYRKALVIGLAFWLGTGFQLKVIFPDLLTGFVDVLLSNGMTSGTIVAIVLMLFLNLTGPRRKRLTTKFSEDALPEIGSFLRETASAGHWNSESADRLLAAGEEALAVLLKESTEADSDSRRNLVLFARRDGRTIELEFVTALEGQNMEDQLAYLNDLPPVPDEHEVSYRLLMHYASTVRHQKYHGIDVITITVEQA